MVTNAIHRACLRLVCCGALAAALAVAQSAPGASWPAYGHDNAGTRYSPLAQINRQNVSRLQVAWVFHAGDIGDGTHTRRRSGLEVTPIVTGGTMYFCTGFDRVIALDPVTGRQKWAYDPRINLQTPYGDGLVCRGVARWPAPGPGAPPARRIFVATEDARLIALDAAQGRPVAAFGDHGEVRLGDRVGADSPGEYHMTSAPTVIGDVVVVGSAIDDNDRAVMPSGVVRGYDARNGALLWTWDPVPHGPGIRTGAANAWAPMAADRARGLVFVPTGSASPDYFGGERLGNGPYADSVAALHAVTGRLAWSFQLVHHDLWDYDTATQPSLLTIRRRGRAIPAVIAANKTGHLFFLDRTTGAPLDPVDERPAPASDVPGERTAATQPFPSDGLSLVPTGPLRPEAMWGLTAHDLAWCRQAIAGLRNEGIFTPPSLRGSVITPGNIGGMAWGGAAIDPQTGLLYFNTNRLPALIRLIPRNQLAAFRRAHPGPEYADQSGTPYALSREFLLTPSKTPCTAPPWGTLTAVDYNAGKIAWSVPLGDWFGIPQSQADRSGAINLAGPMATAGGLVFEGSTLDRYLRAFDARTGRLLWKTELPFSAPATPMTYLGANGRQYLVIAAGGHPKMPGPSGDALVAFTLK